VISSSQRPLPTQDNTVYKHKDEHVCPTERIIGEYQAEFRPGRSKIDQLFTVKQTLERCWECNLSVYQMYVYFKQAFGLPPQLVRLVRAAMTGTEAQMKVQTELTDTFEIRQGLKQDDGLVPVLFNLAMQYVIRKLPADANGTLEYKMNQVVGYSDDICLLGRSARAVNEVYKELKITAEKIGLNINVNKTKAVLQTRTQSREIDQLRIGDHNIEVVDSFVNTGSCITKDNDEYIEIQRRLKLANKAYFSLLAAMRCKDVHQKTNVMLYKTLIRTVLTYGSETWTLSKNSESVVSTFERKILRRIYGPVQDNGQWRIRYNKELYELYCEPDLVTCIN
jgi:hypothetical protein